MTGHYSSKRLIKGAFVFAIALTQLLPPDAAGQSRQLPKAGFQRFSGNLPGSASPGAGIGSISGTGLTSPGVHLTSGMERTARNAREPYNPGEPKLNMALVRWPRNKMPLKIWISPGLQLPQLPFEQLPDTRVETVFQMMQNENPFAELTAAPGWTEQNNYQVAAGIEQWRQFETEGLLRFGFTTNPQEAQIMVFFNDNFQGAAGPGGTNVGALTCAQLFTPEQVLLPQFRQKPVIMEFSTRVNHLPEKMQSSATHEFGHALGIKAHSPYRDDIMNENNVVFSLSEGDKATIRLLYKTEPKFVM
ncbi:MAG: matrixin family metalloprotease [Candidatus Melainabacteria bacterium]|nr:matrixin family metalloprotease [Candidatus Melainabacteria bacterium]